VGVGGRPRKSLVFKHLRGCRGKQKACQPCGWHDDFFLDKLNRSNPASIPFLAIQEPLEVLLANRDARDAIQTLFRGVGIPSRVADFNLPVNASGDEVIVKEQFVSRGLRVAAASRATGVECADDFFSDESHILFVWFLTVNSLSEIARSARIILHKPTFLILRWRLPTLRRRGFDSEILARCGKRQLAPRGCR